jgi:hypothetical protein
MQVALFIVYLSMFIFMFPPFRQYKSRFFYYFFILALEDPIGFGIAKLLQVPIIVLHIEFAILLIIGLTRNEKFTRDILYALPLMIIFGFGISHLSLFSLRIVLAFEHIYIFYIILKFAVIFIRDNRGINFFQVMLIFYESTIIVKFFTSVFNIKQGLLFFYLTAGFEILVAIFFICFREDSKRMVWKIGEDIEDVEVE